MYEADSSSPQPIINSNYGGVSSILANLFKEILINLNISSPVFHFLLEQYVNQQIIDSKSANEFSTAKNALERELLKDTMTWKTFLGKALPVIKTQTMIFNLQIHYSNKNVSEHVHVFDLTPNANKKNKIKDQHKRLMINNIADVELSKFLRKIYIELDFTGDLFKTLIKKQNDSNSLSRELLKEEISWKLFIKGLLMLDIDSIVINLILKHKNVSDGIDNSKSLITRHEKKIIFV